MRPKLFTALLGLTLAVLAGCQPTSSPAPKAAQLDAPSQVLA